MNLYTRDAPNSERIAPRSSGGYVNTRFSFSSTLRTAAFRRAVTAIGKSNEGRLVKLLTSARRGAFAEALASECFLTLCLLGVAIITAGDQPMEFKFTMESGQSKDPFRALPPRDASMGTAFDILLGRE